MTKLLAIFAHPDDEGAVGGTLARYAQAGAHTSLICATRGEAGQVNDPALATAENMGAVREAELRTACRMLGVEELRFLGYRDSGMKDTPENEDPRALIQAEPEEAICRLVEMMRELQPDVVITFEPFGWYGHPDHVAVSRLATEAYDRAAHQSGPDGVANAVHGSDWRPQRLFHAVLPASLFEAMTTYAREHGFLNGDGFEPQEEARAVEARITHTLDVHDLVDVKLDAMWAHRTQFGDDHWFRKIPKEMLDELWGTEYFIQVRPAPAAKQTDSPRHDLLD